jgi:hypothetical protein
MFDVVEIHVRKFLVRERLKVSSNVHNFWDMNNPTTDHFSAKLGIDWPRNE